MAPNMRPLAARPCAPGLARGPRLTVPVWIGRVAKASRVPAAKAGGPGGGNSGGGSGFGGEGGDDGSHGGHRWVWMLGAMGALQILAPGASRADEISDMVDRIWEWLGPIVKQLGYSGVIGLICAGAFKVVGKAVAIAVGLSFILLQTLEHYGYIEIDWRKVETKISKKLDVTGDK
eukprot:evm.model.scf_1323.5 EVM.evm.TU.scf_1323.5   scf_1323:24897-27320(+)